MPPVTSPPLPLPTHAHLTVLEVAHFLRVQRITIYRLIEGGDLPHMRWGHVIRIPRAEFVRWYQQRGKGVIG
jgi:excisionase family DNA binding protein